MLLPLLAYHAFILVGAAVLLIGVIRGSIPLTVGGVILVAVGIAIQTLVLRWSAALTAEAARRGASAPAPSSPADPRTRAEWLCIACAWKGSGAVRDLSPMREVPHPASSVGWLAPPCGTPHRGTVGATPHSSGEGDADPGSSGYVLTSSRPGPRSNRSTAFGLQKTATSSAPTGTATR